MPPLPLLVVVIGRACARASTGADERTFSTANQCSRACANGRANADALRSLLFPSLRVLVMSVSVLPAGNRNRQCKGEH